MIYCQSGQAVKTVFATKENQPVVMSQKSPRTHERVAMRDVKVGLVDTRNPSNMKECLERKISHVNLQ